MPTIEETPTGSISARDGNLIFFRRFPSSTTERARMVIVHGLCEHSGRYLQMARQLAEKGISVTAYDHRGHGQSGGRRGHIQQFDHLLGDLLQIVEQCRKKMDPARPLMILGHSLGGLVALRFAQRFGEKIDGVIASSPALAPAIEIPKPKAILGRLMSRLWPQLMFDNELIPENLSHDDAVVQAYINDPLVGRRISARLFTEMVRAMTDTLKDAPLLSKPLLLQAAGDDRLVDPSAARIFFDRVTAGDKTLHIYDGLFHEIYNEEQNLRKKVLTDLETWLQNHIK